MGRKLRATVHVGGTTYYAGDEPGEDAAAQITNPDAWDAADEPKQVEVADSAPEPEKAPSAPAQSRDERPRGTSRRSHS